MRRRNAQKLIAAGAVVTIGTDNYWAAAPEFTRGGVKPDTQNHGIGSVIAVEGLVELGMTPAQAIVAATRNGAIASRGLGEFGTIETGKRADLLVLDADPLTDIATSGSCPVMRDGEVVRPRSTAALACVVAMKPKVIAPRLPTPLYRTAAPRAASPTTSSRNRPAASSCSRASARSCGRSAW